MRNCCWMQAMVLGMVSASAAWAGGCAARETKHVMTQPATGQVMACQLCYDEIVKVRKSHVPVAPKSVPRHNRLVEVKRHACPDCKTEAVFYDEDGALMVRCARCAPDGVACDRCLPPTASP